MGTDRRVKVYSRPLRYPRDWPNSPAREKGVDVMLAVAFVRAALEKHADTLVLASRDTDLMPVLEMAVDLRTVQVETCTWTGCSRLRFGRGYSAHRLECTYLDEQAYLSAKDPRSY
jgi:hypothetical protein